LNASHVRAAAFAMLALAAPASARQRYDATVTRTAGGVAHVEARDFAGLGYGSGYTAAEG
jgi:acyl-homoserine-lactone acylase